MLRLRDYATKDFAELWKLDQRCFRQGISYSREELAAYIQRTSSFTIIAEDERAIIGFIVADFLGSKSIGHIITIDVDPAFRRKQIGSRLMQAAEENLVARGCKGIRLEVAADNSSAIAFYHRHGYRVFRTIPRYYLASIDALAMLKALQQSPDGS